MNFERVMYIVEHLTRKGLGGWPLDMTQEEAYIVRNMRVKFEAEGVVEFGGSYYDDCRALISMGDAATPHIVAYLMEVA